MSETTTGLQPGTRSLAWGMRWIAIAIGVSYAVRLSRAAVIPKLLAPEQYGLAISLLLPITYLARTDLGVLDQLAKRLPYLRAREGEAALRRHAALGAGWILGTGLMAAFGMVAASYWIGGAHAGFFRYGLRLVAFAFVAERLRFLLTVVLNAREEFRSAQIATMVVDVARFAFSVLLILVLGPIGVIWSLLLAETVGSVYLAAKAGIPRLAYAWRPLRAMVREGFRLFCLALAEMVMFTVDQLFLLRFFTKSEYGLYMIADALASLVLSTASLFDVARPRVMSLAGKGLDEEAKRVVSSTLSVYCLGLALVLGMLAPVSALALRFYLTRYQAGLGLCILVPAFALSYGPALLLRPFFLARNQESRLIRCILTGTLTAVVLDSLVVAFHLGLAGIALSSIFGSGLTSVLLVTRFEGSLARLAKRWKAYALFAAPGLGVGALYVFWRVRSTATGNPLDIWGLLAAASVYELAMVALIYITRAEWLGALRVIRERPGLDAAETSVVLSHIDLVE